jgi:hypothetical protein
MLKLDVGTRCDRRKMVLTFHFSRNCPGGLHIGARCNDHRNSTTAAIKTSNPKLNKVEANHEIGKACEDQARNEG